ncbi:serine hydrolase [soil metagenome]
MSMRTALAPLLALTLAASAGVASATTPAPVGVKPDNVDLLRWTEPQREFGFRHMESVFPTHPVRRGWRAHPLPKGDAVSLPGADTLFDKEDAAAVLVVQDGRIRFERYGRGYGPDQKWTSFSVAKSFTSTLLGAAILDRKIKSIDDQIVTYLPELKGSAYDGVSVRQLLTMTSGVKWNEDYADPKSDVALIGQQPVVKGKDATIEYMRKLPRETAPGSKFVYKTGETNLVGVLVSRVTGKSLAEYLQHKIWIPYGMEQDGIWLTDANGQEPGGFGLSVAAHDYARMGQFVLDGGSGVVPTWWFGMAGSKQADIGQPGFGYGFQWWTRDDGAFDARGIFGQMIHIDPRRKLIVVINSDWDKATGREHSAAREAFLKSVNAAVDAAPQAPQEEPQPVIGKSLHG